MALIKILDKDVDRANSVLESNDILVEAIWFSPLDAFIREEAQYRIDEFKNQNNKTLSPDLEKKMVDELVERLDEENESIICSDEIQCYTNDVLRENGF